jgi:hypothetical protein
MLSEVSQAQRYKAHLFSLIWGRQIQNIYQNKRDHTQTHM